MAKQKEKRLSPWFWVPSLYFAEGIPYIVVNTISVIMYKRMGISNAAIALYTSWLYLPWVIKPLWSPFIDLFKTKRFWIITMQLLIGAGLASIALTIPVPNFFQLTLAALWLLAFSSATHDIAADGFYMLGLTQHQQAWFVGVRSTFYRFAMLTGQGLLVILAGYIESHSGLKSVELNVAAVRQPTNQEIILSDTTSIQPLAGELRIVTIPPTLEIPIIQRKQEQVKEKLEHVRQWNARLGLVTEEVVSAKSDQEMSWWQRNVVDKIESAIKNAFGTTSATIPVDQLVGNIGTAYLHLSDKPDQGKKIVINFGRKSGDKNINLVKETRIVFTEDNWNKPVMIPIQLDAKLDTEASTTFIARGGNIPLSWMLTFVFMTILFAIFSIYHRLVLPFPAEDIAREMTSFKNLLKDFANTFILFFKKERIGIMIAFLLLYRLGESQLIKLASPFLLDSQESGGLGLTTGEVGFVYGTVGIIMLTVGGLLGGFVAAKHGLKKWIWWMAIAINLPDAVYIYMAQALPDNFLIIN
ncbi:MFS transporter, partial [candidate division KSB1 bacterium]|nr:MFS transporter [candidate division KSB1 bacterium]